MAGSNILIIYTSSDGKNVTVSPRLGKGTYEPDYNSAAKITILEGSGVSNGQMTANILCESCSSWSGGSMDFSSSSASFIYGLKSGSPINSDSVTEDLEQHDENDAFTWTISAAKGGSTNVNPFIASSGGSSGSNSGSGSGSASPSVPVSCTPIAASASASGTVASLAKPSGSGCPTAWPSQFSTAFPTNPPAWVTACYPGGLPTGGSGPQPTNAPFVKDRKAKRDDDDDDGDDDNEDEGDGDTSDDAASGSGSCPAGYAPIGSSVTFSGPAGLSASQSRWMPVAHGVLASLVFVGLLPIGGILIRIANFTGLVWVHAALQMLSFLIYIIAFGMGVYMATHLGYMSKAHPILGIALLVILIGQPIFGFLHHKLYKKYGHRTFWSYAHLFHGRIAIFLGMINGGLGIQLVGNTSMGAKAAYGVITALMAVAYIAAIAVGEMRRNKRGPPTYEKSQRAHQLRDLSASEENMGYRSDRGDVRYQQEYYSAKDNRF